MSLPLHSRRLVWILAFIGLAMSAIALRIDLHDFTETPFYLWLFVPICSLYPFLLALNYVWFLRKKMFSPFLLVFTLFGAIGYGIIAPFFYAYYMVQNGFSWYEFGNVFWVWLYASQAFLLWPYLRPHLKELPLWQLCLVAIYFFTKDFLDRFSVTWSYVRFGVVSIDLMNGIFALLLIVHAILLIFVMFRYTIVSDKK